MSSDFRLSTTSTNSQQRMEELLRRSNNVRPESASANNLEDWNGFSEPFSANDDGNGDAQQQQQQQQRLSREEAKQLQEYLARRETRMLWILRIVVLLILITAAALVATFAYLVTHDLEVQEFQDTFGEYAEQIVQTVHQNAQQKLEAVGAIALQLQAYAVNSNQSWPFVTYPFFEEHVAATKSLTDAYGILVLPIVETNQREAWESYALAHKSWINQSYATQRIQNNGTDGLISEFGPDTFEDPDNIDWFDLLWGPDYVEDKNPDFSQGISSVIFRTRHADDPNNFNPRVDETKGPYFPQWQAAEMGWYYQSSVNLNYGCFPDFLEQTQIVRETKAAVYGEAWTDPAAPGYLSTMLYPIFDEMITTTGGNASNVVAYLSMDIFWEAFLARILPPNSDGIYVVISNTCNQTFTYQLFGERVEFVGDEDRHEIIYDGMSQSFVFGEDLMEPISSPTYTGRPLYGEFCPYTFSIYPSQQMQDLYVTDRPIYYCVSAALIFIFSSFIFILYDCLVERRQKLVMLSAMKADKIVSSLFPNAVKERLYQEEENNNNDTGNKNNDDEDVEEFMGMQNPNKVGTLEVSPIAELYEATTVLFMDLVGFTAWSSGRTPSDVFLLLETIYGRFDKIARKRGVFKVETIGDCYVACTGIPLPQENHALIMVRFALDCRVAFRDEVDKLANKLGPKTRDLATRTGLHSGPVTGGVLRGEKARFQLFGDTINVAARMESNGKPRCIHLSEATAALVKAAGKSHWLKAREEKIVAKGKGEMQTYWVEASPKTAASVASAQSLSGGGSDDFGDAKE